MNLRTIGYLAAGWLLLAVCMTAPRATAQTGLPPEGASVSFALTAADGARVTEQTWRGKWLVVYFGYTFCPDICPATLLEIAGALNELGARATSVQGIFISVDPQRDTPAVLGDYVKSFDPGLVGLTGAPKQIALAAKSFRVFYERQETGDGNYTYDHSAFIYIVDPAGKFVKAVGGDVGSKQIAETLTALLDNAHERP